MFVMVYVRMVENQMEEIELKHGTTTDFCRMFQFIYASSALVVLV